jgi:hypothetical protein
MTIRKTIEFFKATRQDISRYRLSFLLSALNVGCPYSEIDRLYNELLLQAIKSLSFIEKDKGVFIQKERLRSGVVLNPER